MSYLNFLPLVIMILIFFVIFFIIREITKENRKKLNEKILSLEKRIEELEIHVHKN